MQTKSVHILSICFYFWKLYFYEFKQNYLLLFLLQSAVHYICIPFRLVHIIDQPLFLIWLEWE